MKANELRIGNYVNHMNNTYQILGLDGCEKINRLSRKWLGNELHGCNIKCKPIPLTEEWLVKFGFEKSGTTYTLNLNKVSRIYYYKKSDGFVELGANGYHFMNVKLEYVHQLQNLYFALTNKELTLK